MVVEKQKFSPSLSVVIPTLGRDRCLLDVLRDLSRQDYSDWECLIVSQGENSGEIADEVRKLLPDRSRIFYLREPNASLARNIGFIESSRQLVLFLDDDVVIERSDFLSCHVKNLENPDVSGVFGQVLSPELKVRYGRHRLSDHARNGWLFFPPNYNFEARVRNGGSGNLLVWRERGMEVGGMDANFVKGAHREESDFCLRYTDRFGLLAFDPKASLIHLGEAVGGCRAWGLNSGVHPLHHVSGEWYFLLRGLKLGTVRFSDLPHHAFVLFRRQIGNRPNLRSPKRLFRAVFRCFSGARNALAQMRRGPRYVNDVDPECYQEK